MILCLGCNKEFDNKAALSSHLVKLLSPKNKNVSKHYVNNHITFLESQKKIVQQLYKKLRSKKAVRECDDANVIVGSVYISRFIDELQSKCPVCDKRYKSIPAHLNQSKDKPHSNFVSEQYLMMDRAYESLMSCTALFDQDNFYFNPATITKYWRKKFGDKDYEDRKYKMNSSGAKKRWKNGVNDGLRNNFDDIKKIISGKGWKLQDENYQYFNAITKIPLICKNNHYFDMTYGSINTGYGCGRCSNDKKMLSFEKVKFRMATAHPQWTMLSDVYSGKRHKLKFKCNNGHIFTTLLQSAQDNLYVCPKCGNKAQKMLTQLLDNLLNISSMVNCRSHPDLKGLELDIFYENLNLAIEFDGQHHFFPVRYGSMSQEKAEKCFKSQIERDKLKNKLCKTAGITLIRWPYTLEITKENAIEVLKSHNIKIPNK